MMNSSSFYFILICCCYLLTNCSVKSSGEGNHSNYSLDSNIVVLEMSYQIDTIESNYAYLVARGKKGENHFKVAMRNIKLLEKSKFNLSRDSFLSALNQFEQNASSSKGCQGGVRVRVERHYNGKKSVFCYSKNQESQCDELYHFFKLMNKTVTNSFHKRY